MGVMRTSLGEPGPAFFPEAAEPYVHEGRAPWYDPPGLSIPGMLPARDPYLWQRDVASLGGWGGYGATVASLTSQVDEQIGQAHRGAWISTLQQARVPADMWRAPTNVAGAWFRVAFWLAVAARVSRNATYIGAAETARTAAVTEASKWGNESDPAKVSQVLAVGAQQVLSMSGGNTQLTAIARALSEQGTESALTSAGRVKAAQNAAVRAKEALQDTYRDAAKVAEGALVPFTAATDLAKAAADPTARPWWFWPVVLGGGTLSVALLMGYFARPYAGLAREAYGDAKRVAREAYAKVRTRTNPRRRRTRR